MNIQDAKIIWEDCSIGFKCPVCENIIVADGSNEELTCDCGKVRYKLNIFLEIHKDEK